MGAQLDVRLQTRLALDRKWQLCESETSLKDTASLILSLSTRRPWHDRGQSGVRDWEQQHLPGVCSSLPAGYCNLVRPTARPQGRGKLASKWPKSISRKCNCCESTNCVSLIGRRGGGSFERQAMDDMKLLANSGLTYCLKNWDVWVNLALGRHIWQPFDIWLKLSSYISKESAQPLFSLE